MRVTDPSTGPFFPSASIPSIPSIDDAVPILPFGASELLVTYRQLLDLTAGLEVVAQLDTQVSEALHASGVNEPLQHVARLAQEHPLVAAAAAARLAAAVDDRLQAIAGTRTLQALSTFGTSDAGQQLWRGLACAPTFCDNVELIAGVSEGWRKDLPFRGRTSRALRNGGVPACLIGQKLANEVSARNLWRTKVDRALVERTLGWLNAQMHEDMKVQREMLQFMDQWHPPGHERPVHDVPAQPLIILDAYGSSQFASGGVNAFELYVRISQHRPDQTKFFDMFANALQLSPHTLAALRGDLASSHEGWMQVLVDRLKGHESGMVPSDFPQLPIHERQAITQSLVQEATPESGASTIDVSQQIEFSSTVQRIEGQLRSIARDEQRKLGVFLGFFTGITQGDTRIAGAFGVVQQHPEAYGSSAAFTADAALGLGTATEIPPGGGPWYNPADARKRMALFRRAGASDAVEAELSLARVVEGCITRAPFLDQLPASQVRASAERTLALMMTQDPGHTLYRAMLRSLVEEPQSSSVQQELRTSLFGPSLATDLAVTGQLCQAGELAESVEQIMVGKVDFPQRELLVEKLDAGLRVLQGAVDGEQRALFDEIRHLEEVTAGMDGSNASEVRRALLLPEDPSSGARTRQDRTRFTRSPHQLRIPLGDIAGAFEQLSARHLFGETMKSQLRKNVVRMEKLFPELVTGTRFRLDPPVYDSHVSDRPRGETLQRIRVYPPRASSVGLHRSEDRGPDIPFTPWM